MELSKKQKGVVAGMATAMLISIFSIVAAIIFNPLSQASMNTSSIRFSIAGLSMLLPLFVLIICVGRLARFRFFSAEDIDGSGLTTGSNHAKVLQSILQNTLEQIVIAFGVYVAWCALMPISWLFVVILGSVLFTVGRLCFIFGYSGGAPARAFGFALTFYSTVVMFVIMVGYVVSLSF